MIKYRSRGDIHSNGRVANDCLPDPRCILVYVYRTRPQPSSIVVYKHPRRSISLASEFFADLKYIETFESQVIRNMSWNSITAARLGSGQRALAAIWYVCVVTPAALIGIENSSEHNQSKRLEDCAAHTRSNKAQVPNS